MWVRRSGCAAKNAASPARLMPVAPEQALALLFIERCLIPLQIGVRMVNLVQSK